MLSLVLKKGLEGAAQINVKGIGDDLEKPTLPLDPNATVSVVVKNDQGICWRADFSAPALKNVQGEFRDKSD